MKKKVKSNNTAGSTVSGTPSKKTKKSREERKIEIQKSKLEKMQHKLESKQLELEDKASENITETCECEDDLSFDSVRKSARNRVAPDGINPNPLEYMTIMDGGVNAYVSVFFVNEMPKSDTFAETFSTLLNYPGVDSTIHIEPVSKQKAQKLLDKRVVSLDSERIAAEKSGDINRQRKINEKMRDAENWAAEIENGWNSIFNVKILFVVKEKSLELLTEACGQLCAKGRENGIELSNAYSVIPEAFLCASLNNRMYDLTKGPFKKSVVKNHIMDKRSLANLYNHTSNYFSYEDGVPLGRDLHTGMPFFFDVFDKRHDGFALAIAGKTGTGKSSTVKILDSRMMDFGAKTVCVDYDSNGSMGEYCQITYEAGGVIYQFKPDADIILNLFEIDVEMEFDEISNREYPVLDVKSKISDVKNIILTMIKAGKNNGDFATDVFLEDRITDIIAELYDERGIIDHNVDSLYEEGKVIEKGHLITGKVKKKLPTITDFVYKALIYQKNNHDVNYQTADAIIIAAMKHYVRELNYCVDTLKRFTSEEILKMDSDEQGKFYFESNKKHYVRTIKGIKPYFDGESTVKVDLDTPCIDFDISQLNKADKPVAQTIVLNYIQENIIKKNSINPLRVENRVMIVDEAHKMFPYYEARKFMEDVYRTARKHHVSPWTITQAYADYSFYEETKAMLKNTACKLLLKQDFQDRQFLIDNTPLTNYQVDELLSLGGNLEQIEFMDEEHKDDRRGEICLIDNDMVKFIKVDYLKSSEARFVETDAKNRQQLFAAMK